MTKKKKHYGGLEFKDYLIFYGFMIGLSPIWISMAIVSTVSLHCRLFFFLNGTTDSAWQRCAVVWARAERAFGAKIGPNFDTPFEHSLTEYFVRYHRRSRGYLIEQLQNPNPYLAAYAFKCLIRYGPISMDEISADVLARKDDIDVTFFGCISETMTLSNYIRNYFERDHETQDAI